MKTYLITALVACGTLSSYGALTAHWDLNESAPGGAGHDVYDNVNGTTLALWGGTELGLAVAGANGDVNGGLYFDGSRASAQLPSADAITAGMNEANDFSIAMWVNPEGAQQANARLVESSGNTVTLGGYRLSMAATVLEFRASNGLIMSGDTVTADTWNLVVLRYDALGVATLNVLTAGDAVDAAFVTGNSAISAASGDISYVVDLRTIFGVRNANTAENEFKGSMDDIMFFSGTLTDQEVSDMYTTVIPEPATLGLVAGMGGALLFIRRKLSM